MMRAAVTYLLATGLLPRVSTIPPDEKQEGLACAAFDIRNTDGTTDESNLAPTVALVVTRKGKQRILHHPPTLKRRDNPITAPPGTMPTPTRAAPPLRTQNEKTKGPGHTGTYVPHSRDHQPAETALTQGEHQGPHPTTV